MADYFVSGIQIPYNEMRVLPEDIILQILRRLPVKSAVKCTAVCKHWYVLINDPSFALTHLQAASFFSDLLLLRFTRDRREFYHLHRDNDAFEEIKQFQVPFESGGDAIFRVVGTCNGLICLADVFSDYCDYCLGDDFGDNCDYCLGHVLTDYCNIILWNPSIHKHFILPHPNFQFKSLSDSTLGFGFDLVTNDYKVLLVVTENEKQELTEVWLFSLNRLSWRRLSEVSPKHCCYGYGKAVFLKGALHWTGYLNYGDFTYMVLVLDLSTEKFFVMIFPETLDHFGPQMSLIKYEESIAMVSYGSFEDISDTKLELWVMKEYGVDSSWTKLLDSKDENGELVYGVDLFHVFGVRKNGDIFLEVGDECGNDCDLGTLDLNCDPQEQHIKRLVFRIDLSYSFVGSFVESLVLLDRGEQDESLFESLMTLACCASEI